MVCEYGAWSRALGAKWQIVVSFGFGAWSRGSGFGDRR